MLINFCRITYTSIMIANLLFVMTLDGYPRDNYNFKSVLTSTIIEFALLWFGGFFK